MTEKYTFLTTARARNGTPGRQGKWDVKYIHPFTESSAERNAGHLWDGGPTKAR